MDHLLANRNMNQDISETKHLREMLKEHEEMKDLLDKQDFDRTSSSAVSVSQTFATIEELYRLELYGQKIKEIAGQTEKGPKG